MIIRLVEVSTLTSCLRSPGCVFDAPEHVRAEVFVLLDSEVIRVCWCVAGNGCWCIFAVPTGTSQASVGEIRDYCQSDACLIGVELSAMESCLAQLPLIHPCALWKVTVPCQERLCA